METADLVLDELIAWPENPSMDAIPKSFEDFFKKVLPLLDNSVSVSNIWSDRESEEYGALRFKLGEKNCLFRQAKTTPKKVGQFVTIWKRGHEGAEIAPFEKSDDVDFVIIAVHDERNQGFFIFDKETLVKKRVFTQGQREGKRAIRVYAPWVKTTVKQAINTQKWQTGYFLSLHKQDDYILRKIRNLFSTVNPMLFEN